MGSGFTKSAFEALPGVHGQDGWVGEVGSCSGSGREFGAKDALVMDTLLPSVTGGVE